MDIYTPYFYVIQEISTGMYYAGSKYAKNSNPKNLMVEGGYTTSSSVINNLIEKNGIESFVVRKIKTFNTAIEAYNYETKFLKKVNAKSNPKFYNAHNNDFSKSYNPNWRKIPNEEGFTSYTIGGRKAAKTMLSNIVNGKNTFKISYEKALLANPNLRIQRGKSAKCTKMIIDTETNLNVYQKVALKMSGSNNPSKKEENAKKISEGRKKYILENRKDWLERQKQLNDALSNRKDENGLTARQKHSKWMKENNPTKGSVWYNNGSTNLRIKIGELIPEGYIQGRLKKN